MILYLWAFLFLELKTIQVYKSSIHTHTHTHIYIYKSSIRSLILRHMSYLIKNFKILNQVSYFSVKIGFQLEFNFTVRVSSNQIFLIFVPNELI